MKKIAIVTGASRGIGRAVAKRLAQDAFAVVVNYLSNANEAEEVVAEIKAIGGEAIAVKADVANQTDVERLFEETMKKFGSVDVVVHNSGIMPLSAIGKNDFDLFDKVISTNLRGAFLVLAKAAQHIASGGRIIAFSSSVLAKNFPTYGPYIASKAGVEGLVHVLANELRGRNVSVNAVAPGPVGTELFLKGKSEEQIAELAKIGHIVYASMRETKGRNAPQVKEIERYATEHSVDLRPIELDVSSQESCNGAIQEIIEKNGHLDVVIHNAGHMVFGPAEAFMPEQLGGLYDVNGLGTKRVNRA